MKDDLSRRLKGAALAAVLLSVLAAFAIVAAGCSPQQVAALKQSRADTQQLLDTGKETVSGLKAHLATMPADDPGRPMLESLLAKAEGYISQAESALPAIDGVIKGAETGDFTDPDVTKVISKLPYGTYVVAVLGLIGFLVRTGQLSKARGAIALWQTGFSQVVASVEKAFPNKSEAQKLALAAVQDETTRQLVGVVKGS